MVALNLRPYPVSNLTIARFMASTFSVTFPARSVRLAVCDGILHANRVIVNKHL